VPIIAISGSIANETVARSRNDDVRAFLAKPFTAPELLQLLSPLWVGNDR
jgi:CheY-like chemotaxis protein